MGVIWLSKIHVVPKAMIVEMQAYQTPKNVKGIQAFIGISGSGGLLFLTWHSAPVPYTHLVKKGHM